MCLAQAQMWLSRQIVRGWKMFISKKMRKADRKITNEEDFIYDSDGNVVVSVKAINKDQIFSAYDYDSNEKLNEELGDYISRETRYVPTKSDVRIKLYTSKDMNKDEVKNAIRNKFKKDYNEVKTEKRRNSIFCLAMFLVGLIFISVLILSYSYFPNTYLDIVLEVGTWVFLWEAIDSFFLRRMQLKQEQIHMLKIVTSQIEVIGLEDIEELN